MPQNNEVYSSSYVKHHLTTTPREIRLTFYMVDSTFHLFLHSPNNIFVYTRHADNRHSNHFTMLDVTPKTLQSFAHLKKTFRITCLTSFSGLQMRDPFGQRHRSRTLACTDLLEQHKQRAQFQLSANQI